MLEAERRIRAIAVVHDILARETTEQVPFDEIVPSLVEMIRETNTISFPVAIEVDGGLGRRWRLRSRRRSRSPVAELLQNAMEHAFPGPPVGDRQSAGTPLAEEGVQKPTSASPPRVELVLRESPDALEIVVRDNGCGLPAGFDIDETRSLGLSIVRDLIRSQLGGTITMETDGGTIVRLDIPSRRRAI